MTDFANKFSSKFIHIWVVNLQQNNSVFKQLKLLLTAKELEKASKLSFVHLRRRNIVCRGVLRVILSKYCSLNPDKLSFSYNKNGKPSLSNISIKKHISFNLSHSNELCAITVTDSKEIGIDLEFTERKTNYKQIAKRFFTPRETLWLQSLEGIALKNVFFRLWTRKEAYCKARGENILAILPIFDSLIEPLENNKRIKIEEKNEKIEYELTDFSPVSNYQATVVIKGAITNLMIEHWSSFNL